MKVFLGGTCNNSKWRDQLVPQLKIESYNPVVPEWNAEAQAREIFERQNSDFVLYVITPAMTGVYSIAEVIDDSNKRPAKTVFCYLTEEHVDENTVQSFHEAQLRSLAAVGEMVKRNGGTWLYSLEDVAKFLNSKA